MTMHRPTVKLDLDVYVAAPFSIHSMGERAFVALKPAFLKLLTVFEQTTLNRSKKFVLRPSTNYLSFGKSVNLWNEIFMFAEN